MIYTVNLTWLAITGIAVLILGGVIGFVLGRVTKTDQRRGRSNQS